MTQFVDVKNMARWIQREGVERIIAEMIGHLERDFARWERFDKIARVASHTPFGVIELMPTSDGQEYSFTYVNGHPSNPARGFQTVTAFGVLADVDNGYPTFLAEMTLLTALRTAAVSAMVAKHLARKDSRRMALIGTGSQSEFQALGFRAAMGIEDLTVHDTDPAAVDKVIRNLEPLGFRITPVTTIDEAVRDADIITTCTADKAQNTILSDHQVAPRCAPQRDRRRLPRQDRAGGRHPAPLDGLRRVPAADPHRGRDPADGARLPGGGVMEGAHRRRAGPHQRWADHPVRLGGLRHQ